MRGASAIGAAAAATKTILLFALFLLAAAAAAAHPEDAVASLPGFAGSTDGQFAGHVCVDEARGANIFYWVSERFEFF